MRQEIRDDAWVCGLCGALVAAGGSSQTPADPTAPADAGGLPAAGEACLQYPSPIAPASGVAVSAAPCRRHAHRACSGSWWSVGVAAVVAIVMGLVLRPARTAGGGLRGHLAGPGATRVIIGTSGSGYVLTMSDDKGKTVGPFATQMQDAGTSQRALEAAADSQRSAAGCDRDVQGGPGKHLPGLHDGLRLSRRRRHPALGASRVSPAPQVSKRCLRASN